MAANVGITFFLPEDKFGCVTAAAKAAAKAEEAAAEPAAQAAAVEAAAAGMPPRPLPPPLPPPLLPSLPMPLHCRPCRPAILFPRASHRPFIPCCLLANLPLMCLPCALSLLCREGDLKHEVATEGSSGANVPMATAFRQLADLFSGERGSERVGQAAAPARACSSPASCLSSGAGAGT